MDHQVFISYASADKGVADRVCQAAPARRTWMNPKAGQIYAWIPPGSFTRGCWGGAGQCRDDEKPAHRVWIAITIVTISRWRRSGRKSNSLFAENASAIARCRMTSRRRLPACAAPAITIELPHCGFRRKTPWLK